MTVFTSHRSIKGHDGVYNSLLYKFVPNLLRYSIRMIRRTVGDVPVDKLYNIVS